MVTGKCKDTLNLWFTGVIVSLVIYILLNFGTFSPCGILREVVKHHDRLAAVLPDSWVDTALNLQYGALSPGQCIKLLVWGESTEHTVQSPSTPVTQPQNQQPIINLESYHKRVKQAGIEAKAAVDECRNKRLTGELRTYVASVNCSNPRFLEAYQNAGYPYMDLIGQIMAKRLEVAERIDAGKLTEGQAQLETAKFITHISDIERQRNSAR